MNLRLESSHPFSGLNPITPSSTDADKVISIEKTRLEKGLISSALLGAKSAWLGEIDELYKTRNYSCWDGYDAKPITYLSKETARTIAEILPLEIASPHIIPSSHGGISFEWRNDKKYLIIEIENKEVSCVLINAARKKKKTSFTESYQGEYEDFIKWIRDEFPINA